MSRKSIRLREKKIKAELEPKEEVLTAPTTGKRGRKRKVPEEDGSATPAKAPKAAPKTPGRGRVAHAKVKLSYTDYVSSEVGERVLSCGEGEQLGHPGRTTTKKPRKVVAGGVHSALLTADGEVYMCGINEQGTVPAIVHPIVRMLNPEGRLANSPELIPKNIALPRKGMIVMLAAGASFTAALTDKGSVIAWGNLRVSQQTSLFGLLSSNDTSGEINVHPLLTKMKDHPVVVIHYKKRVIIAAGENHLVMLEEDGKVLTFGDGKMGQLGRSKRTGSIRPQYMVDEDGRSFNTDTTRQKEKGHCYKASEEDKRELRIFTPGVAEALLRQIMDKDGQVYGIGKNTDNALGLGTWTGNDDSEHWKYSTLERIKFPREAGKIAGTTAKLGCSIAWTEHGDAYAWGCDTSGQLGLGLKDDDDKVVPTPQKITSAHLDGYKIICASISDNHCLFLAKKA
ncbi:hypothetical protein COOONC_08751 [Cooperia oncophora]